MDPGRLNQCITVERIYETRGTAGTSIKQWLKFAEVWAEVEELFGQEILNLRAAESLGSVRFRIRWRSDITPDMRITWRGVAYQIVEPPVDPNGKREEMIILGAQE